MMTFLLAPVALAVLTGFTAAAPSAVTCDVNSFMPCLMSAMTPEIQAMSMITKPQDITEPQLRSICNTGRTVANCVTDQLAQCVPASITDAHTLSRGTVRLLEVCDKPDLYAKAQGQWACDKALKENTDFEACNRQVLEKYKAVYVRPDTDAGPDAMRALTSGKLLKDFCCMMKDVQSCIDPRIHVCTADATATYRQMETAIMEAYGCRAKNAAGCPAVPSPV